MTLRTKTRGRKGKDLKRLDGMKRRLTRRRRSQQQRGGAAEPVTSFASWVDTVNKENSIFKSQPETERDDYSIDRINADSDKHKLPLFNGEQLAEFEMPNGMDIRSAAATVADLLKLIMDSKPNVGQFRNEMLAQQQPTADVLAIADVQSQLQTLADIELTIRNSGESSSEESTKQIQATTDILTDVDKYPLYIWALYYSAPEGENSVPILASPAKVSLETGGSDETKREPQEDIAL